MAAVDLISCLVDELKRRLLDRRHKQAGFCDPYKTLGNFDFAFSKMNRSLVGKEKLRSVEA